MKIELPDVFTVQDVRELLMLGMETKQAIIANEVAALNAHLSGNTGYSHLSHHGDKDSPMSKKGAKAKTAAKKHTMSAEGRAKVAAAAKKRWKAWKAAKKKAAKS